MKIFRITCILLVAVYLILAICPVYQFLFVDPSIAVSPWRWLLTPFGVVAAFVLLRLLDREDKQSEAAEEARRAIENGEKMRQEVKRPLRAVIVDAQEESRRKQQGHANRERLVTAAHEALKTAVVNGKQVSEISTVVQPEDGELILLLAAVKFEGGSYGVIGYLDGKIEEPKTNRCGSAWTMKYLRTFPLLEVAVCDVVVHDNRGHSFVVSAVPDSKAPSGRSWQFVDQIATNLRDKKSAV